MPIRITVPVFLAAVMAGACGGGVDPQAPIGWRAISSPGPSPRWGHTAVFDSTRGELLVFGGTDASGRLSDVWSFSSATERWTQLQTSPGPSARYTSGALFDRVRDRMIIFGGDAGELRDELWALDLKSHQWTRLPTGPSARFDISGTADDRRAWFFGGFRRAFAQLPNSALDDLWELDLLTDTWRELPRGSLGPSPRTNTAMALHDNAIYITGGHHEHFATRETWRYLLGEQRWENLPQRGAPAAGAHVAYATDASCGTLWMTGGDNVDFHDVAMTESLTLRAEPQFRRLAVSTLPAPRRHSAMAFDPSRRRLALFGGWQGQGTLLGDTWILEGVPCP